MVSRIRGVVFLGFCALIAFPALAQNQTPAIQNMVEQYEALTTAERITFLQRIVMIGFQPSVQTQLQPHAKQPQAALEPTVPPPHPKTHNINPPHSAPQSHNSAAPDEIKSTEEKLGSTELASLKTDGNATEESQELHEADLAIAEPKTDTDSSLSVTKETEPHKQASIRLIADPKISYSARDANPVSQSIFSKLLKEYKRKIDDNDKQIAEEDLANEALRFYISAVQKDLEFCGFSVDASANHEPSKEAMPVVETGISRIIINKTLFETSVVGEARASISAGTADVNTPGKLTVIKAAAAQSLDISNEQGDNLGPLKIALGATIEKLSAQVSEKLCKALQ